MYPSKRHIQFLGYNLCQGSAYTSSQLNFSTKGTNRSVRSNRDPIIKPVAHFASLCLAAATPVTFSALDFGCRVAINPPMRTTILQLFAQPVGCADAIRSDTGSHPNPFGFAHHLDEEFSKATPLS